MGTQLCRTVLWNLLEKNRFVGLMESVVGARVFVCVSPNHFTSCAQAHATDSPFEQHDFC